MILGLLLSPGDSLTKQCQSGQLERLTEYYLKPYSRHFKKVFIFSYGDHGGRFDLPKNIVLIPKPAIIPNWLYQLALPLIRFNFVKAVDVFRVFQTAGGVPAVISKLILKKPYLVTYGYDYAEFARIEGQPVLAFLLKIIIPLVLGSAERVIVTDPDNLKISRSILIPNGVDPEKFKPGGKEDPNLVLSVGRLERQKNYKLLIKAIGQSQNISKIKLVIIGQGSLKPKLLKSAKKFKVDLKIIDHLPHSSLVGWYQRAAVFVLTSRIEGNPKALLEAMSCGCACLTTLFSGNLIRDRQTGLIGNSINHLGQQLDRLLTQSKFRRRLGEQARQAVNKNYNISSLVAKEIGLLKP